ncbi:MAG TPA: hypothetical protein VF669_07295 [Tepidisphaeraceae bacterium]|jgi:hypothetical protein
MLSKDELSNGMTFILKLTDAAGAPVQWIASLRGDTAVYWFEVYRRADWAALRSHGGEVFHDRVTEAHAEHVRKSARCIVIHTPEVKAEEVSPPNPLTKPLQPNWENDGGSLAPVGTAAAVQGAVQKPSEDGVETRKFGT